MIYSIVEIVATIMDIVFLIWFVPNFLNTKFYYKASLKFIFLPILFLTLQLTADYFLLQFDTLITVAVMTIVIIYSFAVCKKQWTRAIVAAGLYVIVIMLSSSLIYLIISSLINNSEGALQGSPSPARIIFLVIVRATQFVIYKLILLFFNKKDALDKKNGIALLLFTSFTIFGICALMAISTRDSMQTADLPIFVMLFVFILSNVGVYFFIHQIMKMQRKEYDYRLLEERMRFEQARTEDATAVWDNIRKVRHDLKNHFTILKAKLSEGRVDDCIAYIDRIYPKIESMGNLVHTDNPTLDYLINTKIPNDGSVKVIVSGYADVFNDIDDGDFASLIGNMLDNAFEAVSQIKSPIEKQVELHFLHKNQNRIIICRNTIEKSVLADNENLNSTKNGPNHGLGHIIIDTIATKYNGFVAYTEKDNLFCVQVTLPMTEYQQSHG